MQPVTTGQQVMLHHDSADPYHHYQQQHNGNWHYGNWGNVPAAGNSGPWSAPATHATTIRTTIPCVTISPLQPLSPTSPAQPAKLPVAQLPVHPAQTIGAVDFVQPQQAHMGLVMTTRRKHACSCPNCMSGVGTPQMVL